MMKADGIGASHMCLLIVAYGVSTDAVAIIGANREEAYDRGGELPGLYRDGRAFIAGIDPRAGGTWLGVNDCGVMVAITNRPDRPVPPQARSRGLLVRDLLNTSSSAEAGGLATAELTTGRYGGCNVVVLDAKRAFAITASECIRCEAITPGIHGVTNGNVDDPSDRRVSYSMRKLRESDVVSSERCACALMEICSDRLADAPPLCLHGPQGGTVSSSIIILRAPVEGSNLWHCQGSPDSRPYVNSSHLFCELDKSVRGAAC